MIPNFDHNHVIPPHLGNATVSSDLSPYSCDTLEFCKRFATSKERIAILKGYLGFREKLQEVGINEGFQWLDGSFTEDIETREKRPPNDLDLVTFQRGITREINEKIFNEFIECVDVNEAKKNYKVDHYLMDFAFSPESTVEMTRYWLQLFSHNRLSVWKGMLRIELNTPDIDQEAKKYLESL